MADRMGGEGAATVGLGDDEGLSGGGCGGSGDGDGDDGSVLPTPEGVEKRCLVTARIVFVGWSWPASACNSACCT